MSFAENGVTIVEGPNEVGKTFDCWRDCGWLYIQNVPDTSNHRAQIMWGRRPVEVAMKVLRWRLSCRRDRYSLVYREEMASWQLHDDSDDHFATE